MVCPPVPVSVGPSPALGLGWFGHRSMAPPAAPVCWALLYVFLARVFFLGRLFGLGLVGCGPAWVPAFFWGNSPSLVLVFAWRFLQFGYPGSYSFLGIFAWVLSSRFQCLLIAWGGCGWSLVVRAP